jgi:hypothetical protein
MIAEAIKAAVPGSRRVTVDLQTIRFNDPKRSLRYVYLTPRPAQEALIQFDQGVLPRPFNFTLRGAHVLPLQSKRLAETPRPGESRHARGARTRARRAARKLRKQRLVRRGSHTVEVAGGKAAPVSRFARIRAFGIRALGKPSPTLMEAIRASGQDLLGSAPPPAANTQR